jgi:uncharacterized membrane protein
LLRESMARVLRSFVVGVLAAGLAACREDRAPAASGPVVLPAQTELEQAPVGNRASAPKPGAGASLSFRVEGVAVDDVLNLRSSAGVAEYTVIGAIPAGTVHVQGVGAPTQVGQTTWQRVRYGGVTGWVNARYLKLNVDGPPPLPPAPKNLAALEPLICFGNEPFWGIFFGGDGIATCAQMCEGPAGLRVTSVLVDAAGIPAGFELSTARGEPYLRAVMSRSGKCSDGMSDNLHPFEFSGVGVPGTLSGCCRQKPKEDE